MRWLIAGLISLAFVVPASATGYHHPIFKPIVKAPPKPSAQPKVGGGHSSTVGTVIYTWGACVLVSQLIDTFIVHEVYKRKRNNNDELAAFLCMPGQGDRIGFLLKRKPKELYFYSEVNTKPAGVP